jgi:hypothetical protein
LRFEAENLRSCGAGFLLFWIAGAFPGDKEAAELEEGSGVLE